MKAATLKIGIVGYGNAGEIIHAPLAGADPRLEVTAVSTSRKERQDLARSRGFRVYESAEKLLTDPEIDLAVIATPHDTHYPLSKAAFEAGKHVVCDKLMALNVAEAEGMIAAARTAGKTLHIFHNRRWDGDFLAVSQALRDGLVGELIGIRSWVHSPKAHPKEKWRGRREKGGGIFSDWGAHLMDQALLLKTSPVESVYCRMLYPDPEIDIELAAHCIITFQDGTEHIIDTNQLYHQPTKGYEIWGKSGRLLQSGFDPREGILTREVRGVERNDPPYQTCTYRDGEKQILPPPEPGDWAALYRNVADVILEGAEPAVPAESILPMMRLREAAFESARQKQVVKVEI